MSFYNNNDDEYEEYASSHLSHLPTRTVVSGLLNGEYPIKRNSYDVKRGKSPYYYLDGNGNEIDHPAGGNHQFTPVNYSQSGMTEPVVHSNQVNNSSSGFYNVMRKGEQLASAGLNGLTLGLNDELEGLLGGLGYGVANLGMKGLNKLGFDVRVPQESVLDAMQRGYTKARDDRRLALNNGRAEMPIATAAMETVGSMAANPYSKLFAASTGAPLAMRTARNMYTAGATGITSGFGNTEGDSVSEYAKNMGLGALGAVMGTRTGNVLYGRGDNHHLGRAIINETANQATNLINKFLTPDEEEEERRQQMQAPGYY